MHRLLKRQLAKFLNHREGTSLPLDEASFQRFLQAVEDAYIHNDQERLLLERSGELSLQELNAVTELLKARNAEVSKLATSDSLTGLPNRHVYNDRINHAIARALRHNRRFGIMFIDLDRFKIINDTLGHHVGDLLLKGVAERLLGSVRKSDTVARLGGDEFTILLEEIHGTADAEAVARKLLAALARPFCLERQDLSVTASIGISVFPKDGQDLVTLTKNADMAMYHAKESGKNNVQCFQPSMSYKAHEAMSYESKLRGALDRGEFSLAYQPQVNVASNRIVGLEALLRWKTPNLGQVPPAQFVPLAEETGLILPIGEWVLNTACQQNKLWQLAGLPPVRVAVNISGRQLEHAGFLQVLDRALASSGLDPQWLELELTESAIMGKARFSVGTLGAIQARGVHLSIDDFGTGYSSLAALKRFPIDKLKIDQSFIRDIADDPDDAAITRAIIAMGHSLKLQVIAEGVETEEQLKLLRAEGCEHVQGFLFSAPLPPEAIGALLGRAPATWRDGYPPGPPSTRPPRHA